MCKRLFTVKLSYSELLDEAKKRGITGCCSLTTPIRAIRVCVCVCVCCLGKIGEKS